MSVRPMVKNGLETVSPAEMKASKQEFLALKESCRKLVNLQSRKIAKGKKMTHAPELIKGEISFAKIRLEQDKLLSKMIQEKVSSLQPEDKNQIMISKIVAQLAQSKMQQKENIQML